jgi:glycosyltransferase involved in cell wall biosynthesis
MHVSVIIPAHNDAAFLPDAVRSAESQTYSDLEVIIVDDGSGDETPQVAASLENRRVKLIRQEHRGAAAARNRGYAEAQGGLIQFLDADDLLHPEKVRLQVEALKEHPSRVAVGRTFRFTREPLPEDAVSVDDWCLQTTGDPEEFLIRMWGGRGKNVGMVQPNAWLTPRRVIDVAGPWDESLNLDDDGEFFTRVLLNSDGIVYCPGSYNFYRKHAPERHHLAASSEKQHHESALHALHLKASHLLSRNGDPKSRRALSRLYMIVAVNAFCTHPDVSEEAHAKAREFAIRPVVPKLGGPVMEMIKTLFGWKQALKFRHWATRSATCL